MGTSIVNREQFIRTLESVRPGLSPREILEQSNCFVFRDGQVYTYNDEVFCQAPTGLDVEVVGAVPAEKLLEHLGKQPEESLKIKIKEGALRVAGAGRWADLRMEDTIRLPLEGVPKPTKWAKLPPEFPDAMGVVARCAGTDESVFALTCIHLHPEWIEACDDHQIARWPLAMGVTAATVVRSSAMGPIAALGVTKFAETEGWLHFKSSTGLIASLRRYVDEYPDLTPLLDVTGSKMKFPGGLAEEAERAAVFSGEIKDDTRVLVELLPGKIRIKGRGVTGSFTAVKKDAAYKGKALSFLINPDLLADLVRRLPECEVSAERLKVDTKSYIYVACLGNPDDVKEEDGEHVATTAEVEE